MSTNASSPVWHSHKAVILSPELRDLMAMRAALSHDIRGMFLQLSERSVTPQRETELKASLAECYAQLQGFDARITAMLTAIDKATQ